MATRVISTKLSVEGEAEFKKQMSDVNSHLKTLKSDMALVTAEFKGQANSLEALTAKDKILREQLEQQTEKMRALEEAVKEAAEAYGEQDKRTDGYKQSLNAAKIAVTNLTRELEENEKLMKNASGFKGFVNHLKEGTEKVVAVKDKVVDFKDKLKDGKEHVSQFGEVLKANLASEIIINGAKALANAVGEIGAAAKDSIMAAAESADSIDKASQRVGLSAEEYQKWTYAANLNGIDSSKVDDLAKTQQTFFANAKQGYGEVTDVVARLGHNLDEMGGGAYDLEELRGIFTQWKDEALNCGDSMWDAYEALEAMGISANDLREGDPEQLFQTFVSGLEKQRDAANSATAAYDALGINIADIDDSGEAFNQVIAALADMEDVTQRNALASQIFGEAYIDLAPMLNGGSEAIEAAKGELESLGGVMSNNAVAAGVAFKDSLTKLQTAFDGLKNNLSGEFLPSVTEVMDGMTLIMQGNVEEGMALIEQGLQHFSEQLDQLGPYAEDALKLLVAVIIENLPMILEAGVGVITALIDGLCRQMPELIPVVVQLVETLVTCLSDNSGLLIDAAVELIVALAIGLAQAAPQLAAKAPELIETIVDALKRNWPKIKEAGKDLIRGLWEGISNMGAWIGEKIRGFGQGIISDLKSFFGINSPSTKMRDELGKHMASGTVVGFVDEMDALEGKMADAIPSNFEVMANLNTNLKTPKTGVSAWDLNAAVQTATSSLRQIATGQGDHDVLVAAFKEALAGMAIYMNGKKVGKLLNTSQNNTTKARGESPVYA